MYCVSFISLSYLNFPSSEATAWQVYKYVATRLTWADAELYCVSEKANLVSIHRRSWIRLSDIHKEGRWMWSDGVADLKWNDVPCSVTYPLFVHPVLNILIKYK
uniref:C-type lectin domain-containing protein n=1 Tax=Dicentrarchus labrax TaxID=13489 RepID=A0A8C4H7P4_DICLA